LLKKPGIFTGPIIIRKGNYHNSGATEALFNAITALINLGDEVVVFEPAYDSYVQ
jgi:aspartate/methionine/tyrosine aminotransferase